MEIWNHDLIDICLDFYKEDDVLAVRTIVDNHGDRLPRRKSSDKIDKLWATLEDIV